MKVSGLVVSHGHARELERSLPALAPQVDELVVIANVPGSVGLDLAGVALLENERPLSFAANVNLRRRRDGGRVRPALEPGRVPEPGAVASSSASPTSIRAPASSARSCSGPTARWQPSLRRFPTVLGTIWRRTPLRLLRDPYRHQVSHYGTRPERPVQGDWLLGGACLLMRRSMLAELGGWDDGFRHYVEDIDLAYRAAHAGWERWLVPAALVAHDYAAVVDKRFFHRHTLWHARGMRASFASIPSACSLFASPRPAAGSRSRPGRRARGRLRCRVDLVGMKVGDTVTSTWYGTVARVTTCVSPHGGSLR